MRILLIETLLISGVVFAMVAAIGIIRFPDVFMRLSANAKAATLGSSFILGATALHFDDVRVSAKIAAIIAFLVLTGPVAAHMIGRAAYYGKVPMWKGTICDELGRGDDTGGDIS